MTWKVIGAAVSVGGKVYHRGDLIPGEKRPVLDGHLDERHWENLIAPAPPVLPSKVVPLKKG